MKEIERIKEELKQSPIFNMSLSSKELFHSNFLAWTINKYPHLFINELRQVFVVEENPAIKQIEREANNTDIKIQLSDNAIIIENKVKSVPNKRQLIEYKGNDEKNLYLLLSFIKPAFDLEEIGWEHLSYNKLAKLLKNISENICDNEYDKYLLGDYIKTVTNIDLLLKHFDISIGNSYFDFYSSEKYGLLKEIRFHDFVIKSIMNQLSKQIYTDFVTYFKDNEIVIGRWYDVNIHAKSSLIIQTSFRNGKGILHVEYVCKNNMLIGIMIDGNRYNQYLRIINGDYTDRLNIARHLRNNNLWFCFNSNLGKSNMRNEFNKYAPDMTYKYANIPVNMEITTLIDIIRNDIDKAKQITDI